MLKILEWLITRYRHKTPGDMAHLYLPTHIPVGAAEGCDLLTVVSGRKIKRSQPSAAPTGIGLNSGCSLNLYKSNTCRG